MKEARSQEPGVRGNPMFENRGFNKDSEFCFSPQINLGACDPLSQEQSHIIHSDFWLLTPDSFSVNYTLQVVSNSPTLALLSSSNKPMLRLPSSKAGRLIVRQAQQV
jgi:hypothetical protein